LDGQGEFYKRSHSCPCGSGLVADWCQDETGGKVRACDKCKLKLLYRIFEKRYLEMLEARAGTSHSGPRPLGHNGQWEDLLKGKGCVQVVGLEEAKRQRQDKQLLIKDPNGDSVAPVQRDSKDRSVYLVVPGEYADRVLAAGRVV